MHSRLAIWSCCAPRESKQRRKWSVTPSTGGPGALTPQCTFGKEFTMEQSTSSRLVVYYTVMESPTGALLLVADDAGLRYILFPPAKADPHWREDPTPLRDTIRQLKAWFAGELQEFDLPLAPEGPA